MVTRLRVSAFGFLVLLAGIYSTIWYFIRPFLAQVPYTATMEWALMADLLLIVPFAYYGLVVRPLGWPRFTIIPVWIASLWLASLVLPPAYQGMLEYAKYLIFPLEVMVVGYLAYQAVRLTKNMRQAHRTDVDFYTVLRAQTQQLINVPRVARILAFEIAICYYFLTGWRKEPFASMNHFTYHKRVGYRSVFGVLLFVMGIELVGVHLLLHLWSPVAAWILSALSLYGILWLVGDYHALRLRPMYINAEKIQLRTGLRWEVTLRWDQIKRIQPATRASLRNPPTGYLNISPFGDPKYLITLTEPVWIEGPYGLKKEVQTLGFLVDDRIRFEAQAHQHGVWH